MDHLKKLALARALRPPQTIAHMLQQKKEPILIPFSCILPSLCVPKNLIRFDCVRESHNVGDYGCANLLLSPRQAALRFMRV
jgi:hypothetical protein